MLVSKFGVRVCWHWPQRVCLPVSHDKVSFAAVNIFSWTMLANVILWLIALSIKNISIEVSIQLEKYLCLGCGKRRDFYEVKIKLHYYYYYLIETYAKHSSHFLLSSCSLYLPPLPIHSSERVRFSKLLFKVMRFRCYQRT